MVAERAADLIKGQEVLEPLEVEVGMEADWKIKQRTNESKTYSESK